MTMPVIAIAWDTRTVDPDDYTELVAALNQLVQEHGLGGLERIKLPEGWCIEKAKDFAELVDLLNVSDATDSDRIETMDTIREYLYRGDTQ